MHARRCRRLLCLGWSLLALPLWCRAQVALPATVEVDLIFPRKDIYTPAPVMPIVFAFQNPRVAASLWPGIFVRITQLGTNHSIGETSEYINGEIVFSYDDPFYWYWSTHLFNNTEGDWRLDWSLSTLNCSEDTTLDQPKGQFQTTSVFFTTKNGGKEPDLVADAATIENTCNETTGIAFKVTGILPKFPKLSLPWDGTGPPRNQCAVVPPTPPPAPQPCRVKFDVPAASSITTNLTCREEHHCPSGAVQFRVDRAAWLIAAISLVYFLL
ncbi:f81b9339-526a-4e04-8d73-a9dd038c6558 [Thermothielavioides terrestris]|uniref:F81b9339-526a-4e04-8d73-a9dd038c6558 n=1 Tax=Thermothielavioides terrestris TaxID=2587410 RepID=A0A3S4AMR9_9PEZI|nr:f81b9339-526a-4e04-8d73-a9dd038c6558 [Thermothielavioides terrestris]